MNTQSAFPYNLRWTSDQIADAVPLRLFELFAFDAEEARPAANPSLRVVPPRPWHRAYLRPDALPAFVRIHS